MITVKIHELPPNRCGMCKNASRKHNYNYESPNMLLCHLLVKEETYGSDALVYEENYCDQFTAFNQKEK